MSKYCPACGEELEDRARFCKSCGTNINDATTSDNEQFTRPPAPKKNHSLLTLIGFVSALIIPIVGIIVGIYLFSRDDGSKYKVYAILIIVLALLSGFFKVTFSRWFIWI